MMSLYEAANQHMHDEFSEFGWVEKALKYGLFL